MRLAFIVVALFVVVFAPLFLLSTCDRRPPFAQRCAAAGFTPQQCTFLAEMKGEADANARGAQAVGMATGLAMGMATR